MTTFARNTRAALLTLTALVAVAPAAAQQPAAPSAIAIPDIDYTSRTLANGLKVYALRDTATPTVAVSLWYDVGSKHDPAGRSGFAHLFEHILSRKTENMYYNMINGLTEDVGGVRNASTWYDRTNYYEIVPANYLETMLWTHAERMARPVVDPEVFERERNVVKEELRQRVLAPPYGRLFNFVLAENSFDTSPNRRPTIGSIEDLDAATLEDARAFHEAYYGPDTATLIVSGNFDPAQLDAWVDQYFGSIPARPNKIPLGIDGKEAPRTAPRAVTAYAPNVPLPVAATTWRVPGSAHPDMPAIQVMDAILGRGESSRLYKSLVYDKQIATSVGGNLVDIEDGGYYAPYAFAAGGKSVAEIEAALAAEVERMRNAPVTDAELAEAKNELLSDNLALLETSSERGFTLGEALVRTGDPEFLTKTMAAIQRVTAADVQRVARTWLAPSARVDIRYLNESERPADAPAGDSWANPVPLPTFRTVPPATRPAHALKPEGERQAPPAPQAAVPVTPPTIAEGWLANGVRLVTAKTGEVPLATMVVVLGGGASSDPADRQGASSLLAQLATKGTATRSAQQIAAEIESLGASIGGGAGPDGTSVSVSAPVANLEKAGAILADVLRNATIPAEELERERTRAIDGLSVAMQDPGGLASMVAGPALYGAAPYGMQASGTAASLKALSRDDLLKQYRDYWHPANATIVVSGGIDTASASAMAERLFGGWTSSAPAPTVATARAGQPQAPRTLVIDMPGAGQAAVIAGVRALDRADPAYYDLLVANAVLGVGSNGRLFEEVRTKRALSYGAYSSVPGRADDAMLTASAQTKNETAADVAQIFLDEIGRLGREPFAADAIDKRKAFLSGIYTRQVETSAGFGAMLASLVGQGMEPKEAARYLTALQQVTPASAAAIAGKVASPDAVSLVIVGDASKFIDKLRAIRPDVEVIPAADLDLGSPTLRTGG